MWGTAWPALRRTFHQPLGELGVVLLAVTAGGLVTSVTVAAALRRLGPGPVLASAGTLGALAGTLLFVSPTWWVVVVAAGLVGAAGGTIDSGLNAVTAVAGRTRLLNLLHGAYGIGTALGPLVVTGSLLLSSWRGAYAFLLAADLALALGWWSTRSRWQESPPRADLRPAGPEPDPRGGDRTASAGELPGSGRAGFGRPGGRVGGRPSPRPRPRLVVGLGMALFFAYTGLEVSAGQWSATYARGPLGLSAAGAGAVVFLYWGALTTVRLALAVPRRTPSPLLLARAGTLTAFAGALLVWWGPGPAPAIVGIGVLGGALAPVFPALVSLTPTRVGAAGAQRVIGWQVGAASVGGSATAALAGAVLQHAGLSAFGPFLALTALVVVAASALLERITGDRPVTSSG
jgi:fucose permease